MPNESSKECGVQAEGAESKHEQSYRGRWNGATFATTSIRHCWVQRGVEEPSEVTVEILGGTKFFRDSDTNKETRGHPPHTPPKEFWK